MLDKIIDPVYGEIEIEKGESWVHDIIKTEIFQRTNKLKQLGLCYKVFPAAVQTRFIHLLGAFHLTKLFLKKDIVIDSLSNRQINTIKAAALLHDIGHGPHSHGFEWYLKELGSEWFIHEQYSAKLICDENYEISKILKQNNIDPKEVADLILSKVPQNYPRWTAFIISSQIDADRLDYLLRDEYFTFGNINNTKNLLRIIQKINIDLNKQVFYFDEDDIRLVDDFLYTRFYMYKELYLSDKVNSWYSIVIKMLLIAKKLYVSGHKFNDAFNLLNTYEFLFNGKECSLETYLKTNDDTFDLFLSSLQYENEELKQLYQSYNSGNLITIEQYKEPKSVVFYDDKSLIFIKKNSSDELIDYKSISDLYKIFVK